MSFSLSVSNRLNDAAHSASGWAEKEIENSKDLKHVLIHDWCPAIFKDGYRSTETFIKCKVLYGDIDNTGSDQCTIEDFKNIFSRYTFIIATSRNHQKPKKTNPPADRFHFLFPMDEPFTDAFELQDILRAFIDRFSFCDKSVSDAARFFFGYSDTEIIYNKGEGNITKSDIMAFPIVKKEESFPMVDDIPEAPDYLINMENLETGFEHIDAGLTSLMFDGSTRNQKLLDVLKKASVSGAFADWRDWYRLGLGLKAGGFSFEDFLSLSHPNSEKEARRIWDSSRNPKITAGTLFFYARQFEPTFMKAEIKNLNVQYSRELKKKQREELDKLVHETENDPIKRLSIAVPDYLFPPETATVMKDGTIRPMSINENMFIMFNFYHIDIWRNMMTKRTEISIPGFDDSMDGSDNAKLSKIRSLAVLNHLSPERAIDAMLEVAENNRRHPFVDWVNSITWDGKDRLEDIFNCLKLSKSDSIDREFYFTIFRKWLLSIISANYEEEPRTRGVLTLTGRQGGGKTSFFRSLFPAGSLMFQEGLMLDPHNKDSIEKAITCVIGELGELEGIFKKSDLSALKSFLTCAKDTIRFAYLPRAETFPRRTVYCATVNDSEFLVDTTGSNRFWVIPVTSVDYRHKVDIGQLWAQMKAEYDDKTKNGEDFIWYLTDEENDMLTELNKDKHTDPGMFADMIIKNYNPAEQATRAMSATEIYFEMTGKLPTPSDARQLCNYLRNSKLFQRKTTRNKHKGFAMPNKRLDTGYELI